MKFYKSRFVPKSWMALHLLTIPFLMLSLPAYSLSTLWIEKKDVGNYYIFNLTHAETDSKDPVPVNDCGGGNLKCKVMLYAKNDNNFTGLRGTEVFTGGTYSNMGELIKLVKDKGALEGGRFSIGNASPECINLSLVGATYAKEITNCARIPPDNNSCQFETDFIDIVHDPFYDNEYDRVPAKFVNSLLTCTNPAEVRISVLSQNMGDPKKISLRSDDSIISTITLNETSDNTVLVKVDEAGATVKFTSTLHFNGLPKPGPFSGSGIAIIEFL